MNLYGTYLTCWQMQQNNTQLISQSLFTIIAQLAYAPHSLTYCYKTMNSELKGHRTISFLWKFQLDLLLLFVQCCLKNSKSCTISISYFLRPWIRIYIKSAVSMTCEIVFLCQGKRLKFFWECHCLCFQFLRLYSVIMSCVPELRSTSIITRVCKDERHVLLKMNMAPLLELSQKFWIWNG